MKTCSPGRSHEPSLGRPLPAGRISSIFPHRRSPIRRLSAILIACAWAVSGALALALGLYVMRARSMPDLAPWHQDLPVRDYRAGDDDDFEAYLEREERIFEALDGMTRMAVRTTAPLNRFNPIGVSNSARRSTNWNRTHFSLPETPRGGALLLHGLSDSPYSLRAVGAVLASRGFAVLNLRLPGHGTTPGALAQVGWRDWRGAVALAAQHLERHVPADRPLWLVGYSNGAALAVEHTLELLGGKSGRPPDRLLLLSPALAVTPLAAFAGFQRFLSALPGLTKLAWTDIQPEYDPFKYNSFPIEAAEQIHDLTGVVQQQMTALAAAGALGQFPPILAFQSLADATIPPLSVADHLLDRLPANGSELVVFDVNHTTQAEDLLRPGLASFAQALEGRPPDPYAITIITNESPESPKIIARHRHAEGSEWNEVRLGLRWPEGVYSLSHVAVPFPADDPLYGAGRGKDDTTLRLGAIEARGERGVLITPVAQLMRLRFNPFFALIEKHVAKLVEE